MKYPNIHAGCCSIASVARNAVGILLDRDFPESVERFYSEEFKQKLAISFLDYSVLTDEMIQSRLNNGKFEEWSSLC